MTYRPLCGIARRDVWGEIARRLERTGHRPTARYIREKLHGTGVVTVNIAMTRGQARLCNPLYYDIHRNTCALDAPVFVPGWYDGIRTGLEVE